MSTSSPPPPLPRPCAQCGANDVDTRFKCGRCKIARYCNRKCQQTHWSAHKQHCQPCMGDGGPGSVLFNPSERQIIIITEDGSRVTLHAKDSEQYNALLTQDDGLAEKLFKEK